MVKQWDQYQQKIEYLYVTRGMPLEDVRKVMKRRYGFDASTRSYRSQFDTWGYKKNVRRKQKTVAEDPQHLTHEDLVADHLDFLLKTPNISLTLGEAMRTFFPGPSSFLLPPQVVVSDASTTPTDTCQTTISDPHSYNLAIPPELPSGFASADGPLFSSHQLDASTEDTDAEGRTSLHRAVLNDSKAEVEQLLHESWSIGKNVQSREQPTPSLCCYSKIT